MAKLFLITYNESSVTKAQLVNLFDRMEGVSNWFSQIPGTFFIKTDDAFSAKKISDLLEINFGQFTHVILKVHNSVAEDYYGILAKGTWDNFK